MMMKGTVEVNDDYSVLLFVVVSDTGSCTSSVSLLVFL